MWAFSVIMIHGRSNFARIKWIWHFFLFLTRVVSSCTPIKWRVCNNSHLRSTQLFKERKIKQIYSFVHEYMSVDISKNRFPLWPIAIFFSLFKYFAIFYSYAKQKHLSCKITSEMKKKCAYTAKIYASSIEFFSACNLVCLRSRAQQKTYNCHDINEMYASDIHKKLAKDRKMEREKYKYKCDCWVKHNYKRFLRISLFVYVFV